MKAIITAIKTIPICVKRPGPAVWPVYETTGAIKVEVTLESRIDNSIDFEPVFDAFREKRMVEIQPIKK